MVRTAMAVLGLALGLNKAVVTDTDAEMTVEGLRTSPAPEAVVGSWGEEKAATEAKARPAEKKETHHRDRHGHHGVQEFFAASAQRLKEAAVVHQRAPEKLAKSIVGGREAKLLEGVGFQNPPAALEAAGHKEAEPTPEAPAALVQQAKVGDYKLTSFEDWMDSFVGFVFNRASPSYVLPVSFETAKGATESGLTVLNIITFTVPVYVQYVYPLAFFLVLILSWFACCGAGTRKATAGKLSGKLICETVMCYACLWADLATEHKVVKAGRAWAYIWVFVLLATLWNVLLVLYQDQAPMKQAINLVFAPLAALVWVIFAVERTFTRKYFSRIVDKMSNPNFCSDFCVHLLCAPAAILEEAKFLPQATPPEEKTAW